MNPLLLFFALVLVNETVNIAVSDALLENCSGYVEISGNSKLVNFNGSVAAKNAKLEIIDSSIDHLKCYNSTIEAYHNRIVFAELEKCTLIASLNTFSIVIGNSSSYRNAVVTFTVLNKTMTDYAGNYWLLGYANKVIDDDWDYVADNLVCPYNLKINGSIHCERVLRGMHESYKFHGAAKAAESQNMEEKKEERKSKVMSFEERVLALALGLGMGLPLVVYLIRRR